MHELTLKHGVKVGETVHKKVSLRRLKAKDIFASNEAAEMVRVVEIEGALEPFLLRSPTVANKEALRRQIVKLGELDGPIGLDVLGQLEEEDLDALMAAAAILQAGTGKETDRRGRDPGGKKNA